MVFGSLLLSAGEGLALPQCSGSNWTNCFGTYTSASGAKYVGEFKNDLYHGQGIYTFADASVEEGIWEKGGT